jgi:hypothetical protein
MRKWLLNGGKQQPDGGKMNTPTKPKQNNQPALEVFYLQMQVVEDDKYGIDYIACRRQLVQWTRDGKIRTIAV